MGEKGERGSRRGSTYQVDGGVLLADRAESQRPAFGRSLRRRTAAMSRSSAGVAGAVSKEAKGSARRSGWVSCGVGERERVVVAEVRFRRESVCGCGGAVRGA